MKRIVIVAVVVALGLASLALAQVPYRWSSPLASPHGQAPHANWRSPWTDAPGMDQPSRFDEDRQMPVALREGMRPWAGLEGLHLSSGPVARAPQSK